ITISQRDGEITASQYNHVLNLLDKYDMEDCKQVATPGNATCLSDIDTEFYQGVVGSLLFLTNRTPWELSGNC
ncbi:unnamed protein product, partial [Hapterophycus canaliculatus]